MVEMKVTEQTEASFGFSSRCFVLVLTKTSQKQQPVPESGDCAGVTDERSELSAHRSIADVSMVTGQLMLADIHQKKYV